MIGCFEVPGFGGAATAAYLLFEALQKDGFNVSYVNIISEKDPDYLRFAYGENYGNPKSLENVYNCVMKAPTFLSHPEVTDFIHALNPDLMIGIDFIAAHVMKHAYREKKLILIGAGSHQAQNAILRKKAKDFISLQQMLDRSAERPDIVSTREREAFDACDMVMANSEATLSICNRYYPFHSGRIYSNVIWFAEWIYTDSLNYSHLSMEFSERDIDALFIASSWNRPIKNYRFVKKLIPKLKDLRIHVVGSADELLSGATYHGLVTDRTELFSLMGRSKTVVCPSLFDAAPGILYEASALNCNVVASKNCGNWRICNEQLLVEPFTVKQFKEKIRFAVTRKFEDRIYFFLGSRSYEDLKETIAVA